MHECLESKHNVSIGMHPWPHYMWYMNLKCSIFVSQIVSLIYDEISRSILTIHVLCLYIYRTQITSLICLQILWHLTLNLGGRQQPLNSIEWKFKHVFFQISQLSLAVSDSCWMSVHLSWNINLFKFPFCDLHQDTASGMCAIVCSWIQNEDHLVETFISHFMAG